MLGGIAHAFYREIPEHIESEVRRRVPAELLEVIDEFGSKYGM